MPIADTYSKLHIVGHSKTFERSLNCLQASARVGQPNAQQTVAISGNDSSRIHHHNKRCDRKRVTL